MDEIQLVLQQCTNKAIESTALAMKLKNVNQKDELYTTVDEICNNTVNTTNMQNIYLEHDLRSKYNNEDTIVQKGLNNLKNAIDTPEGNIGGADDGNGGANTSTQPDKVIGMLGDILNKLNDIVIPVGMDVIPDTELRGPLQRSNELFGQIRDTRDGLDIRDLINQNNEIINENR